MHSPSEKGCIVVLDTQFNVAGINALRNRQAENGAAAEADISAFRFCDPQCFISPEMIDALRKDGIWRGTVDRENGQELPIQITAYAIKNRHTRTDCYLLFVDPVQDIFHAGGAAAYTAQTDPLTGLPNRAHFIHLTEKKIPVSYEQQKHFGILYIEFQNLSNVSDTIGIDAEDRLIVQLAGRLRSLGVSDKLLARTGERQFALLVDEMPSSALSLQEAERIIRLLSEPFSIDSHLFYLNASIGISLFPEDADDAYGLLRKAENSMKQAKKEGVNRISLSPHESTGEPVYGQTLSLMADLPAAIENGELYFLLQPQYDAASRRCRSAELLARWKHPRYGEISPAVFIPLAEKSGMIEPLSIKAMTEASKIFSALESSGIHDISLSLNISPFFLMKNDFIETIRFFMENYNLSGKKLNFEITEEILTQSVENLVHTLDQIRQMGIGIEIDDYGTGFTSINYLANLPIDTLKIDRSFVSGIDTKPKERALYKAVYEMARALGFHVVAEGVETEKEHTVVSSFGPVLIQGYYYSKPISPEAFIALAR